VRLVKRLLGLDHVAVCVGLGGAAGSRWQQDMSTGPLATPTVSRNDIHPSSINLQLFNNLTRQRPQASSVPSMIVCARLVVEAITSAATGLPSAGHRVQHPATDLVCRSPGAES
jgi:hypothetical protein